MITPLTLFALAVVSAIGTSTARERSAFPRARAAPSARQYLYVADVYGPGNGGHGVSRFPISSDGMPASSPDLTLDGGLQNPCCIALDSRGHLFVADNKNGVVSEYKHGASGNARPIRQFWLKNDYPEFLAVDSSGYIFVEDVDLDVIDVLPPDARGEIKPLRVIANWNTGGQPITDLLVDAQNRLFVGILDHPSFVYNNPVLEWRQPSEQLSILLPYQYEAAYSLLIPDVVNASIYVPFFPRVQQPYSDDYARVPLAPNSPIPPFLILTKGCAAPVSAVISGEFLLEACNYGPAAVLAYRKNVSGKQHFVRKIAPFLSPSVIRIGP